MPAHLIPEVGGAEILARAQTLAQFSDEPHLLLRSVLTDAHKAAGPQILRWMQDAGMKAWGDPIGNIVERHEGRQPRRPALRRGSHVAR